MRFACFRLGIKPPGRSRKKIMPKRHLQKRAQTVRTLLKSLSANYRNGCPHITEKGVRELVKPAIFSPMLVSSMVLSFY